MSDRGILAKNRVCFRHLARPIVTLLSEQSLFPLAISSKRGDLDWHFDSRAIQFLTAP